MKNQTYVTFRNVQLQDGFWQSRYRINREVSLPSVQKRFEDTGRFEALRFTHAQSDKPLHIFYDSDVAKWIEAVAYLIEKDRKGMQPYEQFVDELINSMAHNQAEDGYLNSYFQQVEPTERFKKRDAHELYCAGHLIDAAVAYAMATGKKKFLHIMEKYCSLIDEVFRVEKSAPYVTCGHEEIELALFRLYDYTQDERYYQLAKYFLLARGNDGDAQLFGCKEYAQDYSVLHTTEAMGHCVRALYLYCGVADLAKKEGDVSLLNNLQLIFDDIVQRKSYLTGGVGSTDRGEGFTVAYDLPNHTAYSESCGAIASIYFSMRLRSMHANAKYGHHIERVLYNAFLSSTSVDGKAFFYENPLEIALEEYGRQSGIAPAHRERLPITQRKEVFDCSCCPPNVNRFVASIGDLVCLEGEDVLYVDQYLSSKVATSFGTITVQEEYATEGTATVSSNDFTAKRLAVRVPVWGLDGTAILNGEDVALQIADDGYAYFDVGAQFSLSLDFHIRPRFVRANPKVRANVGRVALTYGPLVYCLEGVDNGARLNRISLAPARVGDITKEKDFHGLYSISLDGYCDEDTDKLYLWEEERRVTKKRLRFIPYFAFANRGETDMLVYLRSRD